MCFNLVMGEVGSIFCNLGQVGSVIYGLGLGLEKFPLKISNFSIFSLQIKKNLFRSGQKVPGLGQSRPVSYLLCLGRVRAHL